MKNRFAILSSALVIISCLCLSLPLGACGKEGPGLSLRARFDNASIRAGMTADRHLEILVTAPQALTDERRASCPPLDLVLVIDRSGSMQDDGKMEYVKEAARAIVERLRPRDHFALIAYDDRADVLVPLQEAEDTGDLIRRIDRLHPGGSTNLGEGLLAGYREIRRSGQANGVKRVILLSDGMANRGITSSGELSDIASGSYEEGISLSTMGVGAGFNEDLMTTLAMDGGGMYYYIDHPEIIPEILAREFATMQALIASNIVLEVELAPQVEIREVIGNRYEKSGRTVIYNVGEISTGERRRYMINLGIPRLAVGQHPIGKVRLRYTPAASRKSLTFSEPFSLDAVSDPARVSRGWNDEVIERAYIFNANEARKRAALAVDRGDREEAARLLTEADKRLRQAPVRTDRLERKQREIEEYATGLRSSPRGEELKNVQKRAKYRAYLLEGC